MKGVALVHDFSVEDELDTLTALEERAQSFRLESQAAGLLSLAPPAQPAVVEEYVTLEEAGRRLGRSVSSIRRDVKSGTLVGVLEHRPQGGRWKVLLRVTDTAQGLHEASPSTSAADEGLREMVVLLRQQLAHAEQTIDMALGALRDSQRATAQAQALAFTTGETLAALAAGPPPAQQAPQSDTLHQPPGGGTFQTYPPSAKTPRAVEAPALLLARAVFRALWPR